MRLACAAVAAAAVALAAGAATASADQPRVVIAVVPGPSAASPASASLAELFADPTLTSFGLLSSAVGNYDRQQTLLDITQSARVPAIDYSPRDLPQLSVKSDGAVADWATILKRAESAHATLEPGLLASEVPGGAAYAAVGTTAGIDAVLAADRQGRIAQVSLGSSTSLVTRVRALLKRHALVIVTVAGSPGGRGQLDALLAARPANELLLTLEQPPPKSAARAGLLALAAAGLSPRRSALTTQTTRTNGLVTALDLAPTVLAWLHLRSPEAFIGEPITVGSARSLASFRSYEARLEGLEGRRTPAILAFLAVWLVLVAGGLLIARDARPALRIGALAALWLPSTALLAAAIEPSKALEVVIVVGIAYLLALAADRIAPWPRAPAIPVFVMLALYTIDLARGSPLLNLSLLSANPISGSRFYGVGNDLEALLPVLLFAGLAASLPQRRATSRDAVAVAAAGALLTLIIAWGRLGADAGAIFTIGGATAIATALVAPGGITWRRLWLAGAAVLIALGLLAVLDLATGGGAHFTRSVIHANSSTALFDTLRRRLSETWDVLTTGAVWIAVLVCLAVAGAIAWSRERIFEPVAGVTVWSAGVGGGFAGAVLGSIANDSGARLLFVASFLLVCVLAYIRGAPRFEGGS
jgi:hypothetical protein